MRGEKETEIKRRKIGRRRQVFRVYVERGIETKPVVPSVWVYDCFGEETYGLSGTGGTSTSPKKFRSLPPLCFPLLQVLGSRSTKGYFVPHLLRFEKGRPGHFHHRRVPVPESSVTEEGGPSRRVTDSPMSVECRGDSEFHEYVSPPTTEE